MEQGRIIWRYRLESLMAVVYLAVATWTRVAMAHQDPPDDTDDWSLIFVPEDLP